MVMSVETGILVVKKMVYHYLCSYAHEQPEMGLMCVNTLQRDCSNDDPMVRGLALRNFVVYDYLFCWSTSSRCCEAPSKIDPRTCEERRSWASSRSTTWTSRL